MIAPLDLVGLRRRVQAEIEGTLRAQRLVLAELGPDTEPLLQAVTHLLRGGKRLRAAFTYWGYRAAGGAHDDAAVRLATAMEFFQAAALLHDDVMDDSAVRRGAPTAHVVLAAQHRDARWPGDAGRYGLAGAILAGDLCLVWTDEIFASCGLPAHELARGRRCFHDMRTQLMAGQFLDILSAARGWQDLPTAARIAQARKVVRYKSAKYSVEQPLLIGADAAGVAPADRQLLSCYGLDLGEAFQLRDDLLGVYGDPVETGKPAGDDLREGKPTVLLALALDRVCPVQEATLRAVLGRSDATGAQIDAAREAIWDSGAVTALERMIAEGTQRALAALDSTTGLAAQGRAALADLSGIATARTA